MTSLTTDAADLDLAYHALARIACRRGRLDPVSGTFDRALIDALTGLQEVRGHLDREAVAAGLPSPFIRRDMRPVTSTRIAAAEAAARQREAEQAEHERHAANGRAGWAARNNAAPVETHRVPLGQKHDGGDGDCPASIHEGAHTGASAATAHAHATPSESGDHDCTEIGHALSGPMGAL